MTEEAQEPGERRVVHASEILDKIQKGEPVEYDNVIVEGDLDLTKLDLPTQQVERAKTEIDDLGLSETAKVVASAIRIMNSEIKGRVIFRNCILQKEVNLSGAQFNGGAYFSNAQFTGGNASFNDAQFTGGAYFRGAQFTRGAYFTNAQFTGGYADFSGAQFTGGAYFSNAQFTGGNVGFSDAQFNGGAYFRGAQFTGGAYFRGAQFTGGNVGFRGAQFAGGDAYFSNAQFAIGADFNDAQFTGGAYFSNAQFTEGAGFRGAQFTGGTDFSNALFACGAVFINAQFTGGYADFRGGQFTGGYADFRGGQFTGGYADFDEATFDVKDISFESTIFFRPQDQEYPCRCAKRIKENLGDKQSADDYFYREMVGRRTRLQKELPSRIRISSPFPLDYESEMWPLPNSIEGTSGYEIVTIELDTPLKKSIFKLYNYLKYKIFEYFFIQKIFGYGVHPWRLWGWWFFFVFLFAAIYWIGKGVNNATTAQPLT